jgi:hypothetical protein
MATQTKPTSGTVQAPELELEVGTNKLVAIVALFAIVVGIGSMLGGLGGAIYTYQSAAVENIVTPEDARIPEIPVRGPISMWVQSDIIVEHQLERTDGLRFAEMERMIPAVDEAGAPIIGEDGEPVMVPSEARASWINATALTTVLGMGIMAYALSAFAIVVGLTLLGIGLVLYKLRKSTLALV